MKKNKGKLKWIMIIVFLILISVTIIPTTSYTAGTKVKKIYETTDKTADETAIFDWKGKRIVIDLTKFRDEPEKMKNLKDSELDFSKVDTSRLEREPKKNYTLRRNRKIKAKQMANDIKWFSSIIITVFILALIRVYKKRYKINSKEKGFLRITLVLSILAYGITFICHYNANYPAYRLWNNASLTRYYNAHHYLTRDNAPYLAFGHFVAIWIAYAIVKWIIRGFKKSQ